jgi:hypothetical protein
VDPFRLHTWLARRPAYVREAIKGAGQGCAIGSALFERIHQPYAREGQRTGAFRFGDPRAMALAGALCLPVHAVTGITSKSLRGQVAGVLGSDYTSHQMSYDLRRLRLHGLIQRVPHTNTYTLTPTGSAWQSSIPRSATGYSPHCSRPAGRQHHLNSSRPCTPSSTPSAITSPTHGSARPASRKPESQSPGCAANKLACQSVRSHGGPSQRERTARRLTQRHWHDVDRRSSTADQRVRNYASVSVGRDACRLGVRIWPPRHRRTVVTRRTGWTPSNPVDPLDGYPRRSIDGQAIMSPDRSPML